MIYADHAATTRLCPEAKAAMLRAMDECWGNPSSLHGPGQTAAAALGNARETIADLLGASPREIYFTSGGSEGDNQAILSAAWNGAAQGKRHLITSAIEHHAVLRTMEYLESQGFSVTYLPVTAGGLVRPEDVAAAIREDTALVSVMTVNNEVGTIQTIPELSALCREYQVPFHTDAVQAVGHIPVNLRETPVDYLTLSAHKFCGPRGAGVLYAKRGTRPHSLIHGGGQERGKRAGTENLPAILGMAAAMERAISDLPEHMAHVSALRDRLIRGLLAIPGCTLNGDRDRLAPGIVNVCLEGVEGETLLLLLDGAGVCASAGSACSAGALEPSHVLSAMGVAPEIAQGSLRLSLGWENTPEEVDTILSETARIARQLRAMRR